MAFQRPGSRAKGGFGFAFDKQSSEAARASKQVPVVPVELERAFLPIDAHRRQILYCVESHATTIIAGETGSGKTTQIPIFLHQAGWSDNKFQIACTQPRRVAAMTVAARVAQELGCALGAVVGYAVRFEDVTSKVRPFSNQMCCWRPNQGCGGQRAW